MTAFESTAMAGDELELTGPRGLTAGDAAARLARDGRNETRPPAPRSVARRIGAQLVDPLILLLLGAATVTAATGDITDTLVILLVITVNTAIGVAQEVRADRAIAALRRLGAPTCRVVRDGQDLVVPAAEVVTGDLVRLSAGDIVPADLMVRDASQLRIDEAAVTGESVPVEVGAGDEARAGTVVTTGRAAGMVIRTGARSTLGRIVEMTERAYAGATPLQQKLARLGRTLAIWTVAASAVVAVFGIVRGRPPVEMAIIGVSLVVAAVPESLPAVVTLALALGARRMAATRALTRRLTAVETLGSVTVLVSDKTGTLTQGLMAVRRAVTASGAEFEVRGVGYQPDGEVNEVGTGPGGADADAGGTELIELARAAVLCNDAQLIPPSGDKDWTVAGEGIEGSLITFARRAGVDVAAVREQAPRTAEEPFDQNTHRMRTEHAMAGGGTLIAYKGAPESILVPAVLDMDEGSEALRDAADRMAATGLRVLAVAAGPPGGIRALGVVGIGDPARADAADAVQVLRGAGIRTVMVTGDHPATGRAIAGEVGLWQPGDQVVTCERGADLPPIGPDVRVVARALPEDKLTIVGRLKDGGEVVAVTGDGVNDAPALRRADIGVAMGSGTEVAHQAAQLVLADDSLITLEAAVGEGRRVYANIRRFLRYALAGGVAELLTMLVGPFVGLAVPLLPAQILWVNLLTHGLPGVAMGAEPASPDVMRRPPRSPTESVLGAGLGIAVLWTGGAIAAGTLAVGVAGSASGWPWQSMVFLTLGLAQLGVALAVRAPRRPGVSNRWLGLAVALSVVLMLAGLYVGPLRTLLGTEPVSGVPLAVAVVAAVVPGLVVAAFRRRADRHPDTATSGPIGPSRSAAG